MIAMSSTVRAFLSIDVEEPSLRDRIHHLQSRLDQHAAKLKLVEIQNVHFTLRFFGDTPLSKTDIIRDSLQSLQARPFAVRMEGVGAFPTLTRARVIWVGVSDGHDKMVSLKSQIDDLLGNLGYPPDKRFKTHLTIARVRSVRDRDRFLRNIESLRNEVVGTMSVTCIRMKKSTLTPAGPIYETLWEIPL